MDGDQLQQLFSELQIYVGWSEQDVTNVRTAAPLLESCFPDLIDDFYAEIQQHPQVSAVLDGGTAQVLRLKGTLKQWLAELVSGKYDRDYVLRRWRVGHRHVEIGLSQVYVNVALSRLRIGLVTALEKKWTGGQSQLLSLVHSLTRLLDLDLAIIEAAYHEEYQLRQQRIERLAAIGQLAGGVAHEMRNPLNVIRTSTWYLQNAPHATPEKKEQHLTRIERQVERANSVITALGRFTKLAPPDTMSFSISQCVRDVLDEGAPPENVEVSLVGFEEDLMVRADLEQVKILLDNLIRNASEAMPEGGKLTIGSGLFDHEVQVTVTDTGTGITPDQLSRIMEPLYTTKARGMGLGLSLARMIAERNGGSLEATSQPGEGSTFVVTLPKAQA